MFTDEKSGIKIYAYLDRSVSHGTMRSCDLIPKFLDVIRDTPEYAQMMLSINGSNWNLCVITDAGASEHDERWESDDISMFLNESLWDVLNSYAPDGYYFGAHPGDGSAYGFWNCEMLP